MFRRALRWGQTIQSLFRARNTWILTLSSFVDYLRDKGSVFLVSCGVAVALAVGVSLAMPKSYTAKATVVIDAPAGSDPRAILTLSSVYLESLKTYESVAASDTLFQQAYCASGGGGLEGERPESLDACEYDGARDPGDFARPAEGAGTGAIHRRADGGAGQFRRCEDGGRNDRRIAQQATGSAGTPDAGAARERCGASRPPRSRRWRTICAAGSIRNSALKGIWRAREPISPSTRLNPTPTRRGADRGDAGPHRFDRKAKAGTGRGTREKGRAAGCEQEPPGRDGRRGAGGANRLRGRDDPVE